jgi:phage gpG-like protein
MIEIEIQLDGLADTVTRILAAVANASPVMNQISGIMSDAVDENFAQQGRPRWLGLAPSTLQARTGRELAKKPSGIHKTGAWSIKLGQRVARSGRLLQASGRLAASIVPSHGATSATVGTNVVYAAIHQFGGTTKPHVIEPRFKKALAFGGIFAKRVNHPGSRIPARPFLMLTDGDERLIEEAMADYLRGVVDR